MKRQYRDNIYKYINIIYKFKKHFEYKNNVLLILK